MSIQSINPFNNQILQEYEVQKESEIEKSLGKGDRIFRQWKNTSFVERSMLMNKAAKLLENKKEELARVITLEMGKVIRESVGEIEKCASVCTYYAENATAFL